MLSEDSIARFGLKFIVELAGSVLTAEERRLLTIVQPAGVLLRQRNFMLGVDYHTWIEAHRSFLKTIRDLVQRDRLIVCMDHEGGRVTRPPPPITRFPYAEAWAENCDEVARAMAIELRSLGVNLTFSPVADIASNPNNVVIGPRAFGTTPQAVINAVVPFARRLMESGITTCAKHFPGHGDTKVDPHFELPTLDLSIEELRQRELLPFRALIDDGIRMVMTAHVFYPRLDPDNMATLSVRVLKGILREELGFQGVIVSDALGMRAILKEFDQHVSVVNALKADLDLFLVAGDDVDFNMTVRLAKHMCEALDKNEIDEEHFARSNRRVNALLQDLPQYDVQLLAPETFLRHHQLAEALKMRD